MSKVLRNLRANKTKSEFSDKSLNDLDYLSEDSSLESLFEKSQDDLLLQKLEKARGQILTERQDQIVQMVFKGGLSFNRIGKSLNSTRQNIQAQYNKAIKKLKGYFNEH